jgi:putative SOS response-associated peptidase YedK
MCRRYVSPDQSSIEREFDLIPAQWQFSANFNVAPSQAVPAIRVIEGQPDPVLLNWGFGDHGTFNLPIEALKLDAGDHSLLARAQRCIMPALGFYEWHVNADGSKRPFYIHAEDQDVCGFAGFWERESCTIINMPANAMMAKIGAIEARMPAILARDMRDLWLYGSAANAAAALAQYPADRLVAYAVSARVNSLDNNDETLIEPLEMDVD